MIKINRIYNKSGEYARPFSLYLWLERKKFNKLLDEYRQRYYDNLGMIDTLGYDWDKKRFTFSHTSEGGFIWGFRLGKLIEITFNNI